MKIDIHSHILPREWPNLREVWLSLFIRVVHISQLFYCLTTDAPIVW